MSRKIIIKDPMGLHLRAAVQFLEKIKAVKSRIWVQRDVELVDARSVLNLMKLAAPAGAELHFFLDGEDAAEASISIQNFFGN